MQSWVTRVTSHGRVSAVDPLGESAVLPRLLADGCRLAAHLQNAPPKKSFLRGVPRSWKVMTFSKTICQEVMENNIGRGKSCEMIIKWWNSCNCLHTLLTVKWKQLWFTVHWIADVCNNFLQVTDSLLHNSRWFSVDRLWICVIFKRLTLR